MPDIKIEMQEVASWAVKYYLLQPKMLPLIV